MRNAFSEALVAAASQDPRIVLLTGDHGYALFDEFRRVCPDQYINAGVAEQNMVGVAAGLAKAGLRPFVYGLSAFVPIRVLEQIKMDVCYQELPVVFLGDGAGVVYSSLGSSHQSTEDMAALRAVPNLTILSPADAWEMTETMRMALETAGPIYLRMGKADLGDIHPASKRPKLEVGDLYPVGPTEGRVALLATGSMVKTALDAAARLEPGLASVWSVPSIKPLNLSQVVDVARRHSAVITLEEHSVYGGLGSAVAEILCEHHPTRMHRIGIADCFSRFAGSYAYLMEEHGLDLEAVISKVTSFAQEIPKSSRELQQLHSNI